MPALEIAGKYDMRILVKDLPIMDMTESPVVVPLGNEFVEAARGVVLVAYRASQGRMQDSHIEHVGHGIRIIGHEIVGNIALPKTVSMQGDFEFIEYKGIGLVCGENYYIVTEAQTFGDLTFRIMIAIKDEGPNPGLGKPAHLHREEQARMKVAPVAVIKITGYHYKGDLLVNRLLDEIIERLSCRRPDSLGG